MAAPRFDRRGFPIDVKDRAARRALLRHRAVTTTVVAAVVAAPALALWAAYRGGQQEAAHGSTAAATTATSATRRALPDWSLTNQGPGSERAESQGRVGSRALDDGGKAGRSPAGEGKAGKGASAAPSASRPGGGVHQTGTVRPERRSPGRLTVSAHSRGDDTVVTLRASGGSPVGWHASRRAPWLVLSRTSGVLRPGETTTVTISVDHGQEPSGHWKERVVFQPSGAVVTVEGTGPSPSSSPPSSPTDSPSSAPEPSGSQEQREPSASPTSTPSG